MSRSHHVELEWPPRAPPATPPGTASPAVAGSSDDEAEPVWIDAALAALIASWCRGRFGACVSVPVAHFALIPNSSWPRRSLGLDNGLAEALRVPHELWAAGERQLHRLAAAHITTLRERAPIGRDSFVVGVACAIVFLGLNGAGNNPLYSFARLSAGRDTFDARRLALWLYP